MSDATVKGSWKQYLPLANTLLIAIFVLVLGYKFWVVGDSVIQYANSAKDVNKALVAQINGLGSNLEDNFNEQFKGLKTSFFDPIGKEVISPLSEASGNIKALTDLLNGRSLLLQERAKINEEFARIALSQLSKSGLTVFADEKQENSEPADLWTKRAEVEVEPVKWLAWNEKDVLYRLSLKDISLDLGWHNPRQRKWMVEGPKTKKQSLYDWFVSNELVMNEAERMQRIASE